MENLKLKSTIKTKDPNLGFETRKPTIEMSSLSFKDRMGTRFAALYLHFKARYNNLIYRTNVAVAFTLFSGLFTFGFVRTWQDKNNTFEVRRRTREIATAEAMEKYKELKKENKI